MATFMHAEDFDCKFSFVRYFAHCDGLVLAPTDTGIYLFNPATRETVTLPISIRHHEEVHCCCIGLGRDPRSGKYKVARAFYRSWDPDTGMGTGMRMEVLTVSCNGGAAAWREIADDLPYPACNWRTAMTVNGFLFWRVAKHLPGLPPRGLIHLSLADETLGITTLPDSVDPVLPDAFALDELHGELCVTEVTDDETVTIWTLAVQEDGVQGQCWEQRCIVQLGGFFHPLAFLPGGRIMLKAGFDISIYDMATAKLTTVWQMDRLKYQGRRARTWKNLFVFNALRYTESLVRITV
jgi:F-box interacting protein